MDENKEILTSENEAENTNTDTSLNFSHRFLSYYKYERKSTVFYAVKM